MKKVFKKVIIVLAWLLIWELIYLAVGRDIIIASPVNVLIRIFELAITAAFWINIGSSLLRIIVGFAAALIAGTIFGVICAKVRTLDEFFSPILGIIRATPVASFIILLFVFTAKNNIPCVTAFLMALPLIWTNIFEGVKKTDKDLLEMASVYRLNRLTVIKRVYFPEIKPYFLASLKSGLGLSWKAGVAAEVLVNPKFGIGAMLYNSKIYLETCDLFAWTAVIVIISMVLEKIILKAIKQTFK